MIRKGGLTITGMLIRPQTRRFACVLATTRKPMIAPPTTSAFRRCSAPPRRQSVSVASLT
jgi:hypothetical protein